MRKTLKLICIFLSALLVISLWGCGKKAKNESLPADFEDSYDDIEVENNDEKTENTESGSSLKFVIDSKTEKTINGVSKDELLEYPVFENLSNSAHTVTVTAYGNPPQIAIASFVVTKQ